MRAKTIQEMKFKRRRRGLTNYKKRLALVKSGLDRAVVRRTNKRIIAQLVAYGERGDRITASADSGELAKKFGWPSRSNKPTAYLTGLLLAKKAKEKGEIILDIGISTPVSGSIPFVFAKGCVDGGMKLKGTFEIGEEAYNATAIAKYARALGTDEQKKKRQFGEYIAKGIDPESLPKLFNEVRAKILSS